ncbi:protein-tyrosine phosphatase-like protein [Schizophyllum fasciatum]
MSAPDLPPPFINIPGTINLRAVGGLTSSYASSRVKSGTIYRSGDISRITDDGMRQLAALGVTRIFDLRKTSESEGFETPDPTIPGAQVVHCPVSDTYGYFPHGLASRLQEFNKDEFSAFRNMYRDMLRGAMPAYVQILRDIIAHPDEAFLVHCTAGKDRTGLFCAILEMTLGVSDDDIVNDYALTSAGIAALYPLVVKKFQDVPVYRENWDALFKMGSSKPETMRATLAMIRDEYGGAEAYLRQAGMAQVEIDKLRQALLVTAR